MKIYHVATQEDYNGLMEELERKGIKTLIGNSPTNVNNWKSYKASTCIDIEDSIISFSPISFYRQAYHDTPIVEYKKGDTL